MANLRLENVTKRFGKNEAVKDLTLEVQDGEFFVILGPPGAGKTTTLRLIVGLEHPEEGDILIDGLRVNDVYPGSRDIAIVFQNLALYPNRTVYNNIAYPLRERKISKAEIDERVRAVAEVLHIEKLLDRKPAKLSGGERQRVAIGRAIVRNPKAYLMDEPLANLDAKLRTEMRIELKRLQQEMGQTLVYVTHDQVEALSMADQIAVLNEGVLQQVGTPDDIYHFPANTFVATVVGSPPMNFLECEIIRDNGSLHLVHGGCTFAADGVDGLVAQALDNHSGDVDKTLLGIRPENVRIFDAAPDELSFPAHVSLVEPLGQETIIDLDFGGEILKATVPPTQHIGENQAVFLTFDASKVHLFGAKSHARFFSNQEHTVLHPVSTNP